MRIIVTGSEGYIGKWLVPVLNRRGHKVYAFDTKVGNDLLVEGEFEDHVREIDPHLVVHLAAKYGRVWGEIDRPETIRQNAEATMVVADACAKYGTKLLYCSSSEIYGEQGSGFMMEYGKNFYPRNLYGLTKLWGEQICEMYVPVQDLVITRLNMPAGPGQQLGPVGYNALHTFLYQAHRGEPITVHDDTWRSYTWVEDTVEGMALIIDKGVFGRFNVCNSDNLVSSETVAKLACRTVGRDVPINVVPRPVDVTSMKDLDDRAIKELGWEPSVGLEEIMNRTYEWIKNES